MHIFVYASVGFLIACIFGRRQWFYIRPDDSGRVAGSDVQTTLFCALKSRARLPIGKPIAFVSNRKVLLAPPANRLSRWSNAVADDFVNRLAARAEIKTVGHCPQMGGTLLWERPVPSRLENASTFYRPPRPTDRQLGPVCKYRIARERGLSVTRHASQVKSWQMIGKLPPMPRAH